MTSRNQKPDHKIFGVPQERSGSVLTWNRHSLRASERGYTLVALLAVMTLMTLFALAAAPNILQQAQREREKEAIFRGEEVADAIRIYYGVQARTRGQGEPALPTSIDDLLQGVAIPGRTKKLQVLRASAARDPLSSTGEWKFVRPHSAAMADFVRRVMLYSENLRPTTYDPQLQLQEPFMAPPVLPVGGLQGSISGGDDILDRSTGPFIGVSSRSKKNAVITYYGIDQHNQWVFTPLFR
ncbi:MAG TPA: type II secretion system protein [Pyrinomonadaceae bacterium]|nr:type II secretion system protein [Pyrinomonadaceae bacterium]